jgi:hypothetical protein
MTRLDTISQDRAARRFSQIAILTRELDRRTSQLVKAQEEVKALKKTVEGLFERITAAARDDGELPLFDLSEEG